MSTTKVTLKRPAGAAKPRPRGDVDPIQAFLAEVEERATHAGGDVARMMVAFNDVESAYVATVPEGRIERDRLSALLDGLDAAFDDLEALRRRARKLRKTAQAAAPAEA